MKKILGRVHGGKQITIKKKSVTKYPKSVKTNFHLPIFSLPVSTSYEFNQLESATTV